MKKTIFRILGVVCILGALATTLFPSWVQMDGIKTKDLREVRNVTIEDLEGVEDYIIEEIDTYKEEFKDNDLPSTKGGIKKEFKETKTILENLMDKNISLEEIFSLAIKAPSFIKNTENFLNVRKSYLSLIFDQSKITYKSNVEDFLETISEYVFIIWIVISAFVVLFCLATAAVITQSINKMKFFKYIFFGYLLVLVVGICVAIPLISENVISALDLSKVFEDISLKITAMPFIALVLASAPIVFDLIFNRKSKKSNI